MKVILLIIYIVLRLMLMTALPWMKLCFVDFMYISDYDYQRYCTYC